MVLSPKHRNSHQFSGPQFAVFAFGSASTPSSLGALLSSENLAAEYLYRVSMGQRLYGYVILVEVQRSSDLLSLTS